MERKTSCARCGATVPAGARFCPECGSSVAPAAGGGVVTGDVAGTGIAIGHGAQASVTEGLRGQEIAELFKGIYATIESRPEDPDVDKQDLAHAVRQIETEAQKGEAANPSKVRRWLSFLADAAPDVLDVAAAVLLNPVTGAASALRKVAEIVQRERASPE
jgi:RNA polymerase subunit RPABC4/transcription elongation factor Spt4